MNGPFTFIVRLLDAEGALLGWGRNEGVPGPGGLRAAAATRLQIDQHGTAVEVSIQWPACDVARREPILCATQVHAGQSLDFWHRTPLWTVRGEDGVPLPQVTERANVTLVPSTGQFSQV
jgi:hypothetical protein